MSKLNKNMYENRVDAINQVRFKPGMQLLVEHLKKSMLFTHRKSEGKLCCTRSVFDKS